MVPDIVVADEPGLILVTLAVIVFRRPLPSRVIAAATAGVLRLLAVVRPAWLADIVRVHAGVPRFERATGGRGHEGRGGGRLVVLV